MTKCYFTSIRCTVSSVDETQKNENSLYSNCEYKLKKIILKNNLELFSKIFFLARHLSLGSIEPQMIHEEFSKGFALRWEKTFHFYFHEPSTEI